jgi:hypothetical protein
MGIMILTGSSAKLGDPVRLRFGWINGIKSLPVTYRL